MGEPVYRSAATEALRIAPLDTFTAIYHRASGITHLVTAPAPEILAALGDDGLTRAALLEALQRDYDVGDADTAALSARLDELLAAGLVATA